MVNDRPSAKDLPTPSVIQIIGAIEWPHFLSRKAWPFWVLILAISMLILVQVYLAKSLRSEQTAQTENQNNNFAFYEALNNQESTVEVVAETGPKYRYRIRIASLKSQQAALTEVARLKDFHEFNIEAHQTKYGERFRIYSGWFESKRKMNLFRSQAVNYGLDTLVHKQRVGQ